MLNRQAIKNVFLPLVPGEMKLTVTDESTLQVARRGESELDRFRIYPGDRLMSQKQGGVSGLVKDAMESIDSERAYYGKLASMIQELFAEDQDMW